MKNVVVNDIRKNSKDTIDENKLKALREIATYCNRNNISLIFICSPIYNKILLNSEWKIIEDIAKSEHVQCQNFSSDSIFYNHTEYFQDDSHLNDNGARLFSEIVSNTIYKLDGYKNMRSSYLVKNINR